MITFHYQVISLIYLADNMRQVIAITGHLETSLHKRETMDEYNLEFQKLEERGVIRLST